MAEVGNAAHWISCIGTLRQPCRNQGVVGINSFRPAARPGVMAIAFNFWDPDGILEREYCLTDVLPLYVSPMYFRAHASFVPTSALGESVRIYRRRGADGCR